MAARRFRSATEADLDRLVSVALRAYPVPARADDSVRAAIQDNPWSTWDDLIIGEDDSGPAGGGHAVHGFLHPFELWAWGRRFPAGGLGSVAVAPTARGRGWARDLVHHCQREARDRGWPFLLLYPFRPGFYRRLGWGITELRETVRVPARAIPRDPGSSRVRTVTAAEVESLLPVYERWASVRNGFLVRDAASWMKLLLRNVPFVAVHDGADGIDGYLFYRVEGIGPNFLDQRLVVQELVWTDDDAWRGLWGFVRDQADQVTEVLYTPRENDGFLHYVDDASVPGEPIISGGFHRIGDRAVALMTKIVDPMAIAAARPYGPGEGALGVTVHDPLDELWTTSFTLEVAGGVGLVNDADGADLAVDSDAWAAIQCGATSLSAAVRGGRARPAPALDVDRWDAILAAGRWGIFEGF